MFTNTHGLVGPKINMELYGSIGFGTPSNPSSSSSSSSSFLLPSTHTITRTPAVAAIRARMVKRQRLIGKLNDEAQNVLRNVFEVMRDL